MKSKIRIMYVFHTSIIGGGSFCLLNIVKGLDLNLYTPIVLLRNYGPLVDELEKVGAIVYFEKSLSTVPYNTSVFKIASIIQIFKTLYSLPKVYRFLKNANIDIVHFNTMMMYPYLTMSRLLNIKSVIHVRENWPINEHKIQFSIAKKIIKIFANKVVSINKTSANIIGVMDKTTVVYDTIDFSTRDKTINFSEIFGNDFLSKKIFVFFGGYNPQKGTQAVVETFINKFQDPDFRLLIVGADSNNTTNNSLKGLLKSMLVFFNYYSYTDNVKRLIMLDSRIKLIPPTYHVKSIIEQSYCVLSFFTIPHANLSLAESIYLEKPVVAAGTSEAYEYSNEGAAALLFEINNKLDFENKVNYILTNYDNFMNDRLSKSVNLIRDKFDKKNNSVKLNQVYQSMLNEAVFKTFKSR